ncbi:hypothetical protein DICPUDRAFT_34288 [Dictyostelium purpureum]|uniref:DUF4291 domain-containing protein n=1 Tax=Dictyostelium purpureum TaxID=5786 RepID=F0ZMC7_DICPU|nr:uncharacterized protein DICPUDRAFT_34288 [Dictyostelium purpureum]EGC34877.1 hypothetical protein DICPUDRAFT_34288 [Dictyostelium purpureum]|eukprot:XP_003288569.1 hypothetical protein DICPUDRAFT_34288 [Dictyostelium purpureum]
MSGYKRIINAVYDDETVRVYQAYKATIADDAIKNQRFTEASGWKQDRMTWIKPSFCWMLYRSGYATKHNQERILAIDIKRSAFEWILENHIDSTETAKSSIPSEKKKIVVQWDPERNFKIGKIDGCGDVRSIQIGIKAVKTKEYNEDWIVRIQDVTDLAHQIKELVELKDFEKANALLPNERIYKPKNVRFN